MEILLWLVPALVATGLAMAWTSWVGRDAGTPSETDRAKQAEQMARALAKPVPQGGVRRQERTRGVVVRRDDAA